MTARRPGRLSDAADVLALLPAYLAFAVLKHVVPLPALARLAWHAGVPAGDVERASRAVRAVTRLSRRIGVTDRDCLQRSLVLYRELSRAGQTPTLVLGFKQDNGRVRGHAWVEAGPPRSVLAEDVSSYVVAASFGPRGQLSPSGRSI
jgi:hypothetical protein